MFKVTCYLTYDGFVLQESDTSYVTVREGTVEQNLMKSATVATNTKVSGTDMTMIVTGGGVMISGIETICLPREDEEKSELRESTDECVATEEFSTNPGSFCPEARSPPAYAVESDESPPWVIDETVQDADE